MKTRQQPENKIEPFDSIRFEDLNASNVLNLHYVAHYDYYKYLK